MEATINRFRTVTRGRAVGVNRMTTAVAVTGSLGSYFWQPGGVIFYVLDIVVRAYLHFVAGSMAHEAAHGHLGNSKTANRWWGRLAMFPTAVPFVTFRKTHLRHHAATNVAGDDPDAFMNVRRPWQIPLRAWALPNYWLVWLVRNGRWNRTDTVEYVVSRLGHVAVYAAIAAHVGIGRVALGLFPALVLHSFLLWYGFAVKTHEGYSTGAAETRSHNYRGRFLYWFSFGLSMHRLHHLRPGLAWLQMAGRVPSATWRQSLSLARDMHAEGRSAG